MSEMVSLSGKIPNMYTEISWVINLISWKLAIFSVICMWMVFTKAGEGGWKTLIPVYRDYIRFRIANCAGLFWIFVVMGVIVFGVGIWGAVAELRAIYLVRTTVTAAQLIVMAAVMLVCALVMAILKLIVQFKTAAAFGQSGLFGLGLWLLPVVFYAVLAFHDGITYRNTR